MYVFVCFIYMLYVTYVIYIYTIIYISSNFSPWQICEKGWIHQPCASRIWVPDQPNWPQGGSQELQMGNSHSHVIPQLYMKSLSQILACVRRLRCLDPAQPRTPLITSIKSKKKHGWKPVAINFQGFPSCVSCFLQLSSHMLSKARAKPNPPSLKRCTNTERPRESSKSFAWILGWWALWAPHKG